MNDVQLLSVKEAAAYLGVCVETMRRYARKKLLKYTKLNDSPKGRNEYRFKLCDLQAFQK